MGHNYLETVIPRATFRAYEAVDWLLYDQRKNLTKTELNFLKRIKNLFDNECLLTKQQGEQLLELSKKVFADQWSIARSKGKIAERRFLEGTTYSGVEFFTVEPDKEILFWAVDADSVNELTHKTVDEAVRDYLDSIKETDWPDTLTVSGYARAQVSIRSGYCIEDVIEKLDEDYGDPDGCVVITPKMRRLEEKFLTAVLKEYIPYACDAVIEEIVNVREWVEKHKQ